ncbi:stage II sporulation protein M [Candidatus Woesearchaeota archaeon]|nr:stage II sporulation protein M [Candidatus Woesearchaeota archaeon]
MVLENLFPDNWLEKKTGYAFLLGFIYSLVGIVIADLLFGANSGLASVMFTSILLIPSLRKLFVKEEKLEEKEKKFSLKELYKDNKHLIHTYVGIFLGVFVAYWSLSFFGSLFGWNVTTLFKEQVFLDPAISGRATYSFSTFWSILQNNWWVLLACFFLSLISGDGATFFVVWNASAWAVIFGVRGVAAAATLGQSPFLVGGLMLLIILPHMLLEGIAYILSGIAGAVISDEVIAKSGELKKFLSSLVFIMLGFWVLNYVFKLLLQGPALIVLRMVVLGGLVYLLKHVFAHNKKHQEVFVYNYWLFIIALLIFIIGAAVETGVLSYSGLLNKYYLAAAGIMF